MTTETNSGARQVTGREALRESEERYRRIVETANEGIITGDLDGRINFVNKKMSDMLGYSIEELVGKVGLDLMPADQKEKVIDARKKLADKNYVRVEVCFNRKDGSLLWTIGSYAPIIDRTGSHIGNLGMYTDITERKLMENDLQKRQIELESLFNHSNAGLVLFDGKPPYTVLAHNKYYQELFAEPFRTQGMVGKNIYEYAPAVEAQGVVAVFDEVAKTKKPVDLLDFPYDSHPPKKSWFNWHLAPIIHDGEVVAMASMSINVTKQHTAEQALHESEERYHNLFSTMEEGFCIIEMIFDKEGRPADYRFLEINAAFEKQTGLHGAEGKLMRELAPAHEAYWFEIYGNVALTGEPARFVNEAKALNRWFEVYAYRVGRPEDRQVAIVFNDISENKRAEAALRRSEERFRSTMDNMLEGCQILDREWRYVYINEAAESQNRRPKAELIGKRYMDIWPGIESTRVFEVIRRCLDERKADTFENEFTFPDGTIGWFDLTIQPVPEGVFILSMDVTARKKAEAALLDAKAQKQAAQYTRTLIEVSLDPLVTISPNGKITDINKATVRATGVPKEGLIGTNFSDYFTEPEKANQGYRQVFDRGSVTDYPLTIRHKNGALMHVLYNAAVYRDEGGKVLGIFAAARDVTTQRQAAWYTRSLIEASLDPLVTISADGKITDANEAAVRATGVAKEDLIGTDFSLYFTEPEKASQGYRRVFERVTVTDYPLTIRHKNGTLMDVLYNAAVYKDTDGKVLGVFAAARDVTARNRIEEELAVHRRHLEELVAARTAELEAANADLRGSRRAALNLLKDAEEARQIAEQAEEGLHRAALDLERSNKDLEQFAYVASHDLQEPLRAVGGFMGMLKNQYYDKLDDQAREYIDFSVDGAERMQSLIEGLLAFSRVGTRGGEFSSVNLKDALDGALANLKALITESLAVVTSDGLPVVTADLLQMTQLLQNLVANAVKFHGPRHPEIHLGARQLERAWEISVRDNGIGIDPQYFDRIFLIFQRLHTRTQYKGTGIGLAVCKKIVERHGGKIWVESVPGEGSTFYFTIPDKGETA